MIHEDIYVLLWVVAVLSFVSTIVLIFVLSLQNTKQQKILIVTASICITTYVLVLGFLHAIGVLFWMWVATRIKRFSRLRRQKRQNAVV